MSSVAQGAVRTCVGCRTRAPQAQLIRIAQESGSLVIGRQASGRGAWLHPTTACLGQADRRGAFARALRFTGPLDSAELARHLEGLESGASAV